MKLDRIAHVHAPVHEKSALALHRPAVCNATPAPSFTFHALLPPDVGQRHLAGAG